MVSSMTGMSAQTLLHRYFPAVYLALIALLGSLAGWLTTAILGFLLSTPVQGVSAVARQEKEAVQEPSLSDYQIILDRNVFDPGAAATPLLSARETAIASLPPVSLDQGKSAAVGLKDLSLVGTIAAGLNSLVVLRQGKETNIYRLGDQIADGVSVKDISRNTVVLVFRDGSRHILVLTEDAPRTSSRAERQRKDSSANKIAGIKQVEENMWMISKEIADQARENFNELLKQARMEPRIVDGKTDGFVVRMIRPNTFLDQIGLRRGDVVMAINDVSLNSPEKALQIMQQLREAQNISINLLRNDRPVTLEYETN